jgi:pilus assembly protein Flp/PilA
MHLVKEQKMINIQRKVVAFLNDENEPTAIEYAVMVALIIVVSIAAITTLGTKVSSTFSTTEKKITTAS